MSTVTESRVETPGSVTAWAIFARLLMIATFAQSIFAGVYLSAEPWGRTAHRINAYALIIVAFLAALGVALTLRALPGGGRLALSLLGFGVGLFIQASIGEMAADGDRVLWLHIPFGVALIGFTANLEAAVRRVGRSPGSADD